jgi:ABC-type multidrug transport system ATPase subunit
MSGAADAVVATTAARGATEAGKADGDAVIRTEQLTKSYGAQRGIVDLDLAVRRGEVFGFLGPNGAGKSTTIRVLLDLIRATSGRALVLGRDSRRESLAIRARSGYLPGELSLYARLTGRETLRYLANLRGGVDWQYAAALAERLDCDLDRKVADLSTGNKRKVGLIQAFMHRPELLILDEPTSGLDPIGRRHARDLILELRNEGKTVFLSSHLLSEVESTCDTIAVLKRGKLVAHGTPDEVRGGDKQVSIQVQTLDQSAREALRFLGISVEERAGSVCLSVGPESVYGVMHLLERSSARILRIETKRESLEEAFLRLAA